MRVLHDSPSELSYVADSDVADGRSFWFPDLFKHKLYQHRNGAFFVHGQRKLLFSSLEDHHKPFQVNATIAGDVQPSDHSVWCSEAAEGGRRFNWSLF